MTTAVAAKKRARRPMPVPVSPAPVDATRDKRDWNAPTGENHRPAYRALRMSTFKAWVLGIVIVGVPVASVAGGAWVLVHF